MNKSGKPVMISFAVLIFVGSLALTIRARQAESDEKPGKNEAPEKRKQGSHPGGIKLDKETQARIGIELQPLRPATGRPEVTIYGTLEQDPSEEFTLRSPQAGEIVSNGLWPVLGSDIAAGSKVGSIRLRLTAIDQLTLNERLAATQSEVEGTQSSVETAREELNRLKQLNADNKNASDKMLEEAQTRLATEEAKLKAARSSERLIASSLRPDSEAGSLPLEIRGGGQVLEVSAQPGELVASGQILIRVGSFNHLLARLYVPPGQIVDSSVTRAMVALAGHEEHAVPAERVAIAGSVDPKYQGETLLFRIAAGKEALRPGQAVTAMIRVPGQNERGVVIPSRAILHFQGLTWVYVETEAGHFVRSAVTLDHTARGGWVATSGFRPGQQLVVSGAQLLLSEEMKSQLEPDHD